MSRVGAAVIAGYALGRFKKLRLALVLGSALANENVRDKGLEALQKGTSGLLSSPEAKKLTGQVGGQLFDALKNAAVVMAAERVEGLSDRLGAKTDQLRGGSDDDESDEPDEQDDELDDEQDDDEAEDEESDELDDEDEDEDEAEDEESDEVDDEAEDEDEDEAEDEVDDEDSDELDDEGEAEDEAEDEESDEVDDEGDEVDDAEDEDESEDDEEAQKPKPRRKRSAAPGGK
jgi:hypothetical protein